jgi:urease accessory protein
MKKNTLRAYLGTLMGLLLLPATALAHPGHSGIGSMGFAHGFSHPFTGVDHILAMVAVGLWAAQLGGRARWAVPSAFVTLMLVGGALGIAGMSMPFIQEGILLSILVLGVLIAGAFKLPMGVSAAIVGMFALFHGMAHGSEMPLASGALAYSLGFALATALLHGVGLSGGVILQRFNIDRLSQLAGGAIVLGGIYLALA